MQNAKPPCGTAAGALGKPKAAATTAHQRQRRITRRQFKVCAPERFVGTSGGASKRLFFGSTRTRFFWRRQKKAGLDATPVPAEKGFGCPKEKTAWQSFGAFFCVRRAEFELTLPRAPLPLMQQASVCQATTRSPAAAVEDKPASRKATHNLIILNRSE